MFQGVEGGRPALKADNFTAISEPIVQKMWEPRCLTTLRASMACHVDSFTILYNSLFSDQPPNLALYSPI
jgi:hypothetical protein